MMYEYFVNFAKSNNCDFINFIAERNNQSALSFYRKFALNEEVGFVKLIDKEIW